MFKRYSDKDLFFSSIRVINPEYQGDIELDSDIWEENIGLVAEPREYTYPTVLYFDGERYIDLGNIDKIIDDSEDQTEFGIRPVYKIDFKSPTSKYCTGRFSKTGAFKAFSQCMDKFDKEYKEFKQQQNKQIVKK